MKSHNKLVATLTAFLLYEVTVATACYIKGTGVCVTCGTQMVMYIPTGFNPPLPCAGDAEVLDVLADGSGDVVIPKLYQGTVGEAQGGECFFSCHYVCNGVDEYASDCVMDGEIPAGHSCNIT